MLLDGLLRVMTRAGLARRPPRRCTVASGALSLALVAASGCGPLPDDGRPAPVAAPAIHAPPAPLVPVPGARELTILRTPCFGDCPEFTAIVDARGQVLYHGRSFVPRLGLHTGRVAPEAVHAVIRRAIEGGYLEVADDHRADMTDQATVYTSVALERRAWVRDYGQAAPPAVLELEAAIDGLLAGTVWDVTPAVEPEARDACAELARALAQRCRAYLELRGPREDCPYQFAVLDSLPDGRRGDGERATLCAGYLRSLARTPAPSAAVAPPRLGPACASWVERSPGACLAALRAGDPDNAACAKIADAIARFRTRSRPVDGDVDAGLQLAEDWCEFRLRP